MLIHTYANENNIKGVSRLLESGVSVDCRDDFSYQTPLMSAVESDVVSTDMINFLIEKGADVNSYEGLYNQNVLSMALQSGSFQKVKLLVDNGAKVNYLRSSGYNALIDVMHGRLITRDNDLESIVLFLLNYQVDVNGLSDHGESALSIASNFGRFDIVKILLEHGGNEKQLKWTPLMKAVVFGTLSDVENTYKYREELFEVDSWQRTPFILALQMGDLSKVEYLYKIGSDLEARAHCLRPALIFPVFNDNAMLVSWLLDQGVDINCCDEFETTAIMQAAEIGSVNCFRILFESGADISLRDKCGEKAIYKTNDTEIVRVLIQAGESLGEVNEKMRLRLLGSQSHKVLNISSNDYFSGKYQEFGSQNPDLIYKPFWQVMIRSNAKAWSAREVFKDTESVDDGPVWSFNRIGRTSIELPDSRIIEIGGVHEDSYDPDFCVYNDVTIHQNGREPIIYSYPPDVFPPTDFHSATFVNNKIYILGCLGYDGERTYGYCPVYVLDLLNYKIVSLKTVGTGPGWIHGHNASKKGKHCILISKGSICDLDDNKEECFFDNNKQFLLDLESLTWAQL